MTSKARSHRTYPRAAVSIAARTASRRLLVRQQWAAAVSAAAGYDDSHLDAALALLAAVERGMTQDRPQAPA
jgi:hypothetical protein